MVSAGGQLPTLENLRGEAEHVVDHEDGLLSVLGADDVRPEAGHLGVRALGRVVGGHGRVRAAGWGEGVWAGLPLDWDIVVLIVER